ncbi:hypothetical protein AF72_03345 [Xylella taiwanensis]|uniref:Uncharacterized protein n=1 Tax=Xylella taiwanensis TaxID=1444770 RepID=Z9JKK9_9GAMM|nr:hypothetical protein AB672_09540 [Xylella taiwanensis]EWS78940.1 hypothetical protein AF72_03345 [Xylella taiwanensis]
MKILDVSNCTIRVKLRLKISEKYLICVNHVCIILMKMICKFFTEKSHLIDSTVDYVIIGFAPMYMEIITALVRSMIDHYFEFPHMLKNFDIQRESHQSLYIVHSLI